ncbi:SDR family oxidoreductase [Stakelama saccharophila]|uniref:SDR family oxidoreductase n=1 Tax=Stakelama saccharophila TaxID=3075605 RepID=A0ABZ0B6E9_9SPHN|nr:SDR family oxidoreductase [Stakelama sp. W311]WNO52711.1 SDR family oxidoreductase [Stakelama sp. W311]
MAIRLKPLAEQVVVITGATSGIGLVVSRNAAARGARVMLVARDGRALEQIRDQIIAAGGVAEFAVADVGDAAQLRAAGDAAVARFGHIDSWISNAGVAIYGRLLDTPLEEHERLFRTDYFGTVNSAETAIRHLRERGGALIAIGSIVCDIPTPVLGAYAAAKHAVKGYIESLALEVRADGLPISITLVKPSGIDTPIGEHAANHGSGEALIPPPAYDPQLVADAVLHACEHPVRVVTVGGVGRLQVLAGVHFPRLLDWITPFMRRKLYDRETPKTRRDAVFAPFDEGRERSRRERPRRVSLYTAAQRRPAGAAAVAVLLGGLAAMLWSTRKTRRR